MGSMGRQDGVEDTCKVSRKRIADRGTPGAMSLPGVSHIGLSDSAKHGGQLDEEAVSTVQTRLIGVRSGRRAWEKNGCRTQRRSYLPHNEVVLVPHNEVVLVATQRGGIGKGGPLGVSNNYSGKHRGPVSTVLGCVATAAELHEPSG